MKTNRLPNPPRSSEADLPSEAIQLPAGERQELEAAIPFRHSPEQQEHIEVGRGTDEHSHPVRRKWHGDHDPVLQDGGYDSDVVIQERHDQPGKLGATL